MSLFISSLNSGSNGNCYYIGNEEEAILIDAGISCRETEKRLKRLHLSIEKIKAIFVSHEHSDHITGIVQLAKKYQLPIYITAGTRTGSRLILEEHLAVTFAAYHPVKIGGLTITPFPKFHDACDPHSFIVSSSSVTVGIFTDIGIACDQVIRYFQQCHAAFLESNYDVDMLNNGRYPYYLKKRISGGKGHLSNAQALALFLTHRPPFMTHLLLSHLSQNNNCPKLVEELFSQYALKTQITVASRFEETPVFQVTALQQQEVPSEQLFRNTKHLQLSLF
ncbi:MAG: MBL fold metallo-hydrolase [Chitinophagaceae bacterium]